MNRRQGVNRLNRVAGVLGLAMLVAAGAAEAHAGHGTDSFFVGLAHPWLGWDHLLAMLALGVWAVQAGGPARAVLPLAFAASVAVSFAGSAGGSPWPGYDLAVLATLLILGGLLAMRRRVAMLPAILLTAACGVAHGYAHGVEINAADTGALAYGAGLVLATLALHGLGMLTATGVVRGGRVWLLRVAGLLVASGGLGGLGALALAAL